MCYKQWGLLVPATTPCGHPRQHQLWLAANTGNGAPEGGVSIDDDADSGLGRLRFNKRQQDLPQELQGAVRCIIGGCRLQTCCSWHGKQC
jgi:hypothetical protein